MSLSPAPLTDADQIALRESLTRMQLAAPDDPVRLQPLAGGVSSLIVRADTPRGPLCVKRALAQLKVAAHWEAPVERNRAELAWLRLAGTLRPGAVPEILGDDATHCAFAMQWLEPRDFPLWKQQLRDGWARTDTARAVAQNLVAIHAATADRPALAREFAHDANFHALRLEPYFLHAATKHPAQAEALRALVRTTADTRRCLVHGDISPKNILVGPQGPVFLDAECAWYGDPAFDLAFCLNHLLLKTVWRPDTTADFLACFDVLAATYLEGVDWEPPQALEARTAALLAGLLLGRVDGKSPAEYLVTEAQRARVRRAALDLIDHPAPRLSALRQRWSAHA